ncbi:MAG: GNAT family N-acetyltransferase [Desulfovibrionales bacterium]|nr:GNAT family N-acetyltransferase [Desulfovibrionales bacterium]
MDKVIKRARNYTYHSFQYVVPSEPAKVFEGEGYILVAEQDHDRVKLFWAADSLVSLKEAIKERARDLAPCEIVLEFIPPEFIEGLEENGFRIISEWVDFWLKDLQEKSWDFSLTAEIRLIEDSEIGIAAVVTRSCAGMSREFKGELEEGILEWMNQKDQEIFVATKNGQIVGICMMALYDGKQGKVAWLRELAVHPDYQYQGIGRSLAKVGLEWGQKQGCSTSFLATDIENFHAIRLYEKLGYQQQKGRGQINIAKKFY